MYINSSQAGKQTNRPASIMLFSVIFFVLISQLSSLVSCTQNIKFIIFRTGHESVQQLALLPRIKAFADFYGGNEIEEHLIPVESTYKTGEELLHASWFKMEITRGAMASSPQTPWILTFELSALPTDGSAAIDFAALIAQNPSVSVFLKRVGLGFGMAMYKNDEATRLVVDSIWMKRSGSNSVAAAFSTFAFWNPSILTKVKFI